MKKTSLAPVPIQCSRSAVRVLHHRNSRYQTCVPLNWHDHIEFLHINTGRLYITHGTELVSAGSGEVVIIPPNVFHAGHTRDEGVDYDVLMFDVRSFYNESELCKDLLSAIFEGKTVFRPITDHAGILDCVKSICLDSDQQTLDTTINVYRLLNLLYQNALVEFRAQPMNAEVRKIMDYLKENASQELTIAQLCKHFCYTPAHLCRKFKKATGLPPMNYLKIYRLELAQEKLRNSTASVNLVAAECGFSDANYFTRCFKERFGVSPLAYRKELQM